MNYTIWEGLYIHRWQRAGPWEAFLATRTAHYTETERTPLPGGIIPPLEIGPHYFFRLPPDADPWILLAVHETLVHTTPDDTEMLVIDPDYFTPRIVKKSTWVARHTPSVP